VKHIFDRFLPADIIGVKFDVSTCLLDVYTCPRRIHPSPLPYFSSLRRCFRHRYDGDDGGDDDDVNREDENGEDANGNKCHDIACALAANYQNISDDNVDNNIINISSRGENNRKHRIESFLREKEGIIGNRYLRHRQYRVVPHISHQSTLSDGISSPKNGRDDVKQFLSDATVVTETLRSMAGLRLKKSKGRQKLKKLRYLIIINPKSGTGSAPIIYRNLIRPMLNAAGIHHELFETLHSGHATFRCHYYGNEGYARDCFERKDSGNGGNDDEVKDGGDDVSKYDALIVCGGDGILFEAMKGLRKRNDFDTLCGGNEPSLPIGIVGCGTSNGLATSLLHAANPKENNNVFTSIFQICKGHFSPIDLSHYETLTVKNHTSFLTFSWAFISDIDIDSECIRFLGSTRYEIWAVWRILNLRLYRAKFSYLPPVSSDDKSNGNGNCDNAISSILPPLEDTLNNHHRWVTEEDDFILFWVSQVSHSSHDQHQSPKSKLTDGIFRIMIVRGSCSRYALAKILITMGNGSHENIDECEFVECIAFRLEPLTKSTSKGAKESSYNDLDGEVIESGPIQGMVLPSAVNFFS